MRHTIILNLSLITLIALSTLIPSHSNASNPKPPTRGFAVLASSIGTDISPEALAEVVRQGRYSPVVVDWAWVTYHFERTDFKAVNKFLGLMAEQKVPVAGMYRPRFLSNPTVATQIGKDGKAGDDHAEICYSDPAARKWGISWGEKILEKCPSFKEIIIYNPLNQCRCKKCATASAKGANYAVMGFLSEAKSAWWVKKPEVKLGVVYMPVPDFWTDGLAIIDVAHPYLCIRQEIDPASEVANIKKVKRIVGDKIGASLGKITWEETAKVSIDKLKQFDDLAYKGGISYFFWTYETLFNSPLYDPKAVIQALGIGSPRADEQAYSPASVSQAEELLDKVLSAAHGAEQFAAIDDTVRKIKESDANAKGAILSLARSRMTDTSRSDSDRWPYCYVVGRSGDQQGVPDLIDLLQDNSDIIRAVTVEALGGLIDNKDARSALMQLARREKSKQVRDTIARYLGKTMPDAELSSETAPSSKSITSTAVQELAPSGPPQPPTGPARPVAKPLPWPFPGDSKDQNIFNNYQTSTDDYIHCALDFLHPVGTPVTAVGSGYVGAIWFSPTHTHDSFIVTPTKGGNKGWCYTHMDPETFTFKLGDHIKEGELLGKLVKFSPDEANSMDHLDLCYVSFTQNASGQLTTQSLIDPLYFFDWKDTEAPTFKPLWFVADGTSQQFPADPSGIVTVSGKVDVLAAITDNAYPGQQSFLGVPVVMFSISDGTHTMQKLALDHRGDVGDKKLTEPLYLPRPEGKALANPGSSFYPYYQVLRVTKTNGDGKITPADASECWDTTALDSAGKPLWPDGNYSVNVYAWDNSGNRGVVGVMVQVNNKADAD